MKPFELRSLYLQDGAYVAVLYNRIGGYYKEHRFFWYSKHEIFRILRTELHCSVSHDFY